MTAIMDQVYHEKAHKLTAARIRNLAATAGTDHERAHWQTEACRFDKLAAMNIEQARSAYRPVASYDPERPIVRIVGTITAVTLPRLGTAYLNRDRLTTAYLALLERADDSHAETVRVKNVLMAEHGFDSTEATRLILAASALIRFNIEP